MCISSILSIPSAPSAPSAPSPTLNCRNAIVALSSSQRELTHAVVSCHLASVSCSERSLFLRSLISPRWAVTWPVSDAFFARRSSFPPIGGGRLLCCCISDWFNSGDSSPSLDRQYLQS